MCPPHPNFPPVFSSLSVLYKLCCCRSAAQSLVLQTRVPATSYPPAIFSFLCIFPSYHQALHFPAPPCLLEHLTPLLFLLPKRTHRETAEPPQQFLIAGEGSTVAFSLSVLAVPGGVLGAAISLLHSQIVSETQGGRQRRTILFLSHDPAVFALCPSFPTLRKQSQFTTNIRTSESHPGVHSFGFFPLGTE